MDTKRKIRFVSSFYDRHGNERVRFRRRGFKGHYFKVPVGSPQFWDEYRRCLGELPLGLEGRK